MCLQGLVSVFCFFFNVEMSFLNVIIQFLCPTIKTDIMLQLLILYKDEKV